MGETTHIPDVGHKGIEQCNNCGAYATRVEDIEHYKTCQAGESERWEKLYQEESDNE